MNLTNFNQAKLLKIAAVAIAAPRYMGAFGLAIGLDVLQQVSWLSIAEIYSGGAMALLEGLALAFVLGKWRLLKPGLQWWVLLAFICLLAATLPAVAVPYLLAEQNNLLIGEIFADLYPLQVAWSFLVAGVPMLVIMAVGFADVPDELERLAEQAKASEAKRTAKTAERTAERKASEAKRLPFACPACGKRFSQQNALNGHLAHCKTQANESEASSESSSEASELDLTPISSNGHGKEEVTL